MKLIKKTTNIDFSQVLSYSNNMIEFMINKDDIVKIVNLFVNKYEIEKSMAEAIYEGIKYTNQNSCDDKEKEIEDDINQIINRRPKAQRVIKKSEQIVIDKRSQSFKIKDSNNKKIIIEKKKTINEEINEIIKKLLIK